MQINRSLITRGGLCPLFLAVCVLVSRPFADVGLNDEFSYVWSAKRLAETGHIAYVGWASAMLGWQLALGALFIKVFGFSFTVVRTSILLVAMGTTFLLQRTFVRLGLSEGNALFATLTMVLSPLFIPLSFSFMTDISALFAIILSLYCCVRAVESLEDRVAVGWLVFAAIASAILGTARQTGWLGVLVIVPSAFWILRRRHMPRIWLALLWVVCLGFIFGCLHWFGQQMYTTRETTAHMVKTDHDHVMGAILAALRFVLETAFFLLPLSIAFVGDLFKGRGWPRVVISIGFVLLCSLVVLRPNSYWVGVILAPSVGVDGSYVTPNGVLELPNIGRRAVVLQPGIRDLLTLGSYLGTCSLLAFLFRTRRREEPAKIKDGMLSWKQVAVLLGPLTAAYCVFLLLRALSGSMFDRYLLPLLAILVFCGVRLYQERIGKRLPAASFAVLVLFAGFGIAGTHDLFAVERARLAAVEEMRTEGLPRTSFYGGFGYDGWTQIQSEGYVDADDVRLPADVHHVEKAHLAFKPCGYTMAKLYPAIHAQYAISYDQSSCERQSRFAPVQYRLWLPPFHGTLYIQQVNDTAGQ